MILKLKRICKGGHYMISVGRDEFLSRFAGIPAVLETLHHLYSTIKCEKFHPFNVGSLFLLSGSHFTGTKPFHVIVSLSGMKQ